MEESREGLRADGWVATEAQPFQMLEISKCIYNIVIKQVVV